MGELFEGQKWHSLGVLHVHSFTALLDGNASNVLVEAVTGTLNVIDLPLCEWLGTSRTSAVKMKEISSIRTAENASLHITPVLHVLILRMIILSV